MENMDRKHDTARRKPYNVIVNWVLTLAVKRTGTQRRQKINTYIVQIAVGKKAILRMEQHHTVKNQACSLIHYQSEGISQLGKFS